MPAFQVASLDMIRAVVQASEELECPTVMQITEKYLEHVPLELIGPAMVTAAENASTMIAVNLDLGHYEELFQYAMDLGFSSVMYDGSRHGLEKNIEYTRKVVEMAEPYGVSCEAVLLGKDAVDVTHSPYTGTGFFESDVPGEQRVIPAMTDPSIVKKFCQETGVDGLVIAAGNRPHFKVLDGQLQVDRIKKIAEEALVPLVMQGGSGISDADLLRAVEAGVRKVNFTTENFRAVLASAKDYLYEAEEPSYLKLKYSIADAMYHKVKRRLQMLAEPGR